MILHLLVGWQNTSTSESLFVLGLFVNAVLALEAVYCLLNVILLN